MVEVADNRRHNDRVDVLLSDTKVYTSCTSCGTEQVSYDPVCKQCELEQYKLEQVTQKQLVLEVLRKKLQKREQRLEILRKIFSERGDTRIVKGFATDTTNVQLTTFCSACGSTKTTHANTKYECQCQVGDKIRKAQTHTNEFFVKRFKARTTRKYNPEVKIVGKYHNMGTKVDLECTVCGHGWSAFPSNILRGVGCPICAYEKSKATNLKNYGVEFSVQRPEVQKKIRKTMRTRYGVSHALQNRTLFSKMVDSSYSYKLVRLGGKVVKVQGFEPQALELLAKTNRPANIYAGEDQRIPSIPYTFRGKSLVYHPDIFLPKKNLVVEVKSQYTYAAKLELNLAKKEAVIRAGFKFKFLIL